MTSVATMTHWARKSLKVAMSLQMVEPKPCETCNMRDVFAHQTDLARPLAIKWLCARCETVPLGAVCFHAAPAAEAI
ncbi:hypothetical protein X728_15230 [Mesorhizobium sp. L103C120A0]|nr:hypothetical protein X728_15230 [Mesorhizobium sp. L103C120A0]